MVTVSVLEAVRSDLAEIGRRDERLAASGLAASALSLAAEMDSVSNSATSKAMCAKALRDCLDRLWELAPDVEAGDKLDELSSARRQRRAKLA